MPICKKSLSLFIFGKIFLPAFALLLFSAQVKLFAGKIEVADASGKIFEFDSPPKAISLTPSTTEIICEIGADEFLTGVSIFCEYPKSLKKYNPNAEKISDIIASKTKVGSFFSPNYEKILLLKPDLVILPNSVERTARDKFKSLGIPVFLVHPDGLDNVLKNVEILGKLFDHQSTARQHIENFNKKIPQKTMLNSNAKRAALLFDNGYLAGEKSFAGELIERFGYKNIAGENLPMWFVPQKEFILASKPEVIFLVQKNKILFEKEKSRLENDPIWNPKNQTREFIFIEQDLIQIPALRLMYLNTKAKARQCPARFEGRCPYGNYFVMCLPQ